MSGCLVCNVKSMAQPGLASVVNHECGFIVGLATGMVLGAAAREPPLCVPHKVALLEAREDAGTAVHQGIMRGLVSQ